MVIISKDLVREPLYAIVPLFNPWRWKSRYKHTERAIKHFIDAGAVVYLVEIGFNRRELVFADSGIENLPASNCGVLGSDHNFRHRYIPLHTKDELWLKENAINVGAQHLPYDWQQVCWLDADVHFARPNWVGECIQKLQHYAFIQMFSHARDLGPNYEMLGEDYPHADGLGFVQAWQRGLIETTKVDDSLGFANGSKRPSKTGKPQALKPEEAPGGSYYAKLAGGGRIWPGLAWACTRQAWDAVGGLFDTAIWGGGDWHMSHCLIEKTEGMMRQDLHQAYQKMVQQWYHRCRTHIRMNVGTMSGSIFHHWHGKKTGRGYNTKHSMLAQYGFDPLRHLKRDSQGLWQLHDDRSPAFVKIRDMMRVVAQERNEDSIDI